MKLSLYNWIVEHNNDVVAYNGFTGAMARLEPENVSKIRTLFSLESSVDDFLENVDDELKNSLSYGGYVIDDDFDERKYLRIMFYATKFHGIDDFDGFTVVMTRRCNFRCVYCFEADTLDSKDSLSEEAMERIVEIAGNGSKKMFTISLYGGEPLLEYEKCIELCRRCKEVVEARDAQFHASIITNGYLMTPPIAERLKKNGLNSVQITIDGSRETHNRNRPLKNGDGTYDRIIKNVEACSQVVDIDIRMNAKSADLEGFDELRERFSDNPNVSVHIAPVDLNCQGNPDAFSTVKRKIAEISPAEDMKLHSVNARVGGCGATRVKPNVVLPDGKLVRCWEHVGDCESSCTIFDDPITEDMGSYLEWVGWDPYLPGEECYECRYLPNCAGGCPMHPITKGKLKCLFSSEQEYVKSILGSYISIKRKKESAREENTERRTEWSS